MNGPEEKETRSEMKDHGQPLSFEDAHLPEFERSLARAMKHVEVRAETTAKLHALADEAAHKHQHAGGSSRLLRFSNAGRGRSMPRSLQPRAQVWSWMGGAIAAVLVMGCFVGAHVHVEHERQMQAQRQFETAERITDQTLARTREQLSQRGIQLEP